MRLQAFHGDPAIKAKYLARVRWHREQDHLMQGVGWESNGVTRGCAIGCTLEAYDHSRYPVELGLPKWLARLEDRIFEGLPVDDAMAWPERFLSAIRPGADVENVRHQLAIRRMTRLIDRQGKVLETAKDEYSLREVITQVIAAIEQVRSCHEAKLEGNVCEWSAARSAAESAAWSAAESAEWSAAESAEWSAAESAAELAAISARSAARSAWQQEAKDLIELLEAA